MTFYQKAPNFVQLGSSNFVQISPEKKKKIKKIKKKSGICSPKYIPKYEY